MAPGNATAENNDGISMTTPAAAAAAAAAPTSNDEDSTTTTESFESRLDQLLHDLEQMEQSGTTSEGDRDATIQAFAKFLQQEEQQHDHKRSMALPSLSLPRLIGVVPQQNVDQAVRLAHQSVAVLVQGVSRVAQESVHLAHQLNTTKVRDSDMTYEQALGKVGKSATGFVKIMADLVQDSATFVASELQQQQQQALARQDQKRQQDALQLQLQAAAEQAEQEEEEEEDTATFDNTPWSKEQQINQGQAFFHNLFQSASHVVNELQDKVDTSFLARTKKQYNNNNNNNNNTSKDDAKTIGTPSTPPVVTQEQSTVTSKQGQSGSASASWNNVPFFLQKNDF